MNQSDFAALFDLNRPALGSYEEGRAEPKLATLEKISRHFKLTLDDLICRELTVNEIAGFNHLDGSDESSRWTEQMKKIDTRLSSIESLLKQMSKK